MESFIPKGANSQNEMSEINYWCEKWKRRCLTVTRHSINEKTKEYGTNWLEHVFRMDIGEPMGKYRPI